jgi:tetratricopeptide (TPR) repeat protein
LDAHGVRTYIELSNRGDVLLALGRHAEAEDSYTQALALMRDEVEPEAYYYADTYTGLGRVRLLRGDPAAAASWLERALSLRRRRGTDGLLFDTQLALAQALWARGGDSKRALRLAHEAHDAFVAQGRDERARAAQTWLDEAQAVRR